MKFGGTLSNRLGIVTVHDGTDAADAAPTQCDGKRALLPERCGRSDIKCLIACKGNTEDAQTVAFPPGIIVRTLLGRILISRVIM